MLRPDPDAAFFEDWSRWEVLGGNGAPKATKMPGSLPEISRVKGGDYWCVLYHNVIDLGNQPGFVLRVPDHVGINRLIKQAGGIQPLLYSHIHGSTRYSEGQHRHYVPADRWRDLRGILPCIKQIIDERDAK